MKFSHLPLLTLAAAILGAGLLAGGPLAVLTVLEVPAASPLKLAFTAWALAVPWICWAGACLGFAAARRR